MNMNRVITIIVISTLLSFASANVSKQEFYQMALLEHLSTQEAFQLNRDLATEECLAGHDPIFEAGINGDEFFFNVSDEMVEVKENLDRDSIDSDECSDLGGRVVSLDFEFRGCVDPIHFRNVPMCLHSACEEETTYVDEPVTFSLYYDGYGELTCQMTRMFSETNSSPIKSKMNTVLALAVTSLFTNKFEMELPHEGRI